MESLWLLSSVGVEPGVQKKAALNRAGDPGNCTKAHVMTMIVISSLVGQSSLHPCLTGVTWELVRNADCQATPPPVPTESESALEQDPQVTPGDLTA